MSTKADPLNKADTVALWHAVEWMALCLRVSPLQQDDPAHQLEIERLTAAKRALRKVNAIRKQAREQSRLRTKINNPITKATP